MESHFVLVLLLAEGEHKWSRRRLGVAGGSVSGVDQTNALMPVSLRPISSFCTWLVPS